MFMPGMIIEKEGLATLMIGSALQAETRNKEGEGEFEFRSGS
jgi:hypothetical protein